MNPSSYSAKSNVPKRHALFHRSLKSRAAVLLTGLVCGGILPALAGRPIVEVRETPAVAQAPEENPFSFFGGKVVLDMQERIRWEIRENNFDFSDRTEALTDDNWFLNRFRVGLLIKPTSWLRIYAQGQDAQEINSDRPDIPGNLGAEGDDHFDLRQAYVEFGDPEAFPLTVKIGRQVLAYGDERLIGESDWTNFSRTFDAVKLRWAEKKWSLDAFASTVVVPTRFQYNQSDFANGTETHRNQIFSGLYFSTVALPCQTTDLYLLHLSENQNPRYLPAARGDTSFFTMGFRIKSKPGYFAPQAPVEPPDGKSVADGKTPPPPPAPPKPIGFDYDAEFAFQNGELRGLDLTAWAVHAGVGYTFDASWLPRLGLAYNHGSGDSDPNDADSETFQNLFPTNHKFYGQMDVFSWQNMHEIEASVRVQPLRTLSLKAEFHAFWLASTDDVWDRANGATAVRPLTAQARNADSYAGSEVDVLVNWVACKNFEIQAGYSHFFAGQYLAETGTADDADFGYVQTKISF